MLNDPPILTMLINNRARFWTEGFWPSHALALTSASLQLLQGTDPEGQDSMVNEITKPCLQTYLLSPGIEGYAQSTHSKGGKWGREEGKDVTWTWRLLVFNLKDFQTRTCHWLRKNQEEVVPHQCENCLWEKYMRASFCLCFTSVLNLCWRAQCYGVLKVSGSSRVGWTEGPEMHHCKLRWVDSG